MFMISRAEYENSSKRKTIPKNKNNKNKKNNENYEKNMKIAWSRKQFPTRWISLTFFSPGGERIWCKILKDIVDENSYSVKFTLWIHYLVFRISKGRIFLMRILTLWIHYLFAKKLKWKWNGIVSETALLVALIL